MQKKNIMDFKKVLLTISVSSILILGGCSKKQTEEKKESIKYVKVERISNHNYGDKIVFNGTVKEQSLTTLSFRVGGPLVRFNVKAGDYVKKGAVIASIDKRDYQLQLKAKEAQYLQLKGEYERYKELHEIDKIPENSFEKIESGYLMAKTGYESAKNQLRDTDLKAPISGYIHEKFTENFQTVGAGMPIVSIIDLSKLEVVISVSENQLAQVKNSSNNLLSVKNASVEDLPISIVSISKKAGNDGLYEMKFNFQNNKTLNIAPGMSAQVTMVCNKQNNEIKIPTTAVFHEEKKSWVWIYNKESKKVAKRNVMTGKITNGGFIEVTSGLKNNEMIVTAGVHQLFEGQQIKPIQEPSETNVGGLL